MYPDETSKNWAMQPWNVTKAPIEKEVKNVTINFGPQHPAAHGVLRLVLELDGEVCLELFPISNKIGVTSLTSQIVVICVNIVSLVWIKCHSSPHVHYL